jgi:hypothetical protein
MGAITAELYDLQSNLLADISAIALEKNMKRILDGPRTFTIQSIAARSEFTDLTAADGLPNLWTGCRKLIVWEDGITDPIFHGRVTNVERNGQGKSSTPVTIVAATPDATDWGYDADNRAGRVVRDETGNFITPKFNSGGAISGPDLIQQAHRYSQGPDAESGTNPGEGPLPIDIDSGTFDITVPPAVDLSSVDSMDWPVMLGDFIQQLVKSGVCDYDLRPLAPGAGLNLDGLADPYIMVELSAESHIGTDRSATVHFDYGTGSKNAGGLRHVQDFSTICNKLYDYLGPRIDQTHWRGNITPGSPGTTVDPTDSRTLYGGQFISIRIFDSIGNESGSRPLYIALWNAEQGMRVFPRDMFFVTPSPGSKALFDALADYDAGDDVAVNAGGSFGLDLAASQRVYGFTKTWDRQGVARVSEILTSADIA